MKKICWPLIVILVSGILTSCGGWSSEDEKAFMSNCQSEAVAGILIGGVVGKLLDKEILEGDVDIDSYCECSMKYAKKHWNSFEEFKTSSEDKDIYVLECATGCNKYLGETE